jgi:hypothetical protein
VSHHRSSFLYPDNDLNGDTLETIGKQDATCKAATTTSVETMEIEYVPLWWLLISQYLFVFLLVLVLVLIIIISWKVETHFQNSFSVRIWPCGSPRSSNETCGWPAMPARLTARKRSEEELSARTLRDYIVSRSNESAEVVFYGISVLRTYVVLLGRNAFSQIFDPSTCMTWKSLLLPSSFCSSTTQERNASSRSSLSLSLSSCYHNIN